MNANIRVDAPYDMRFAIMSALTIPTLIMLGLFFVLLFALMFMEPFNRWIDGKRGRMAVLYVPFVLGVGGIVLRPPAPRPSAQSVVAAIQNEYGVTYLGTSPATVMPTRQAHSNLRVSAPYSLRINSTGRILTDCATTPISTASMPYLTFKVTCGHSFKEITVEPGVKTPAS